MTGLDLFLLRPLWLVALLGLGAYAWWSFSRQGGLGTWHKAANPELLAALSALGRIQGGIDRTPVILSLLAAGLMILALSGPAVERRDAVTFRNLDGVVLVMDASRSVTEAETWPQMLTMGRFAIASLGTRPGGLVVFAGDSYIATDMTTDHLDLGQTFSLVLPETVPDPGSRPERGLAAAADMLKRMGILTGDVILFTDGAGLGPETLEQAQTIARQGARLSIVTSTEPTPLIVTHVREAGGQTFGLDQTDALAEWLRIDARTRLEQQDFPLLFAQDFGRYVLALALIPMLLLFRRTEK